MAGLWDAGELKRNKKDIEVGPNPSTKIECSDENGDITNKESLTATVSDAYRLKSQLVSRAFTEIGMGRYQWELFVVTGLGWVVNNLMTQGLSAALTPISLEFDTQRASYATVAYYVGMAIGALFFGIIADFIGRLPAFNITLFITAIFCVSTTGANNFVVFTVLWGFVGIGSGGNVPIVALLFLEFVPATSQWLLTVLSAWWCFGQLIASLVGWVFLANFSCQINALEAGCHRKDNMGWRYALITMGLLTFSFAFMRILAFKLPESPRYLLSMGRDADAIAALNFVAKRNGKPEPLKLVDLEAVDNEIGMPAVPSEEMLRSMADILDRIKQSAVEYRGDNIKALFATRKMGFHCTVLWIIWATIGIAYPLYFNFIPSYLAAKFSTTGSTDSLSVTYRKYCIVSAVGVAGPIAAGFLVETRFGRRWMLAISFVLSGVFLFLYTTAANEAADLGFQCATAVLANFSYAILYTYTPESFPAPHRGAGSGIANSLQFLSGILAPQLLIFLVARIISANTGFTTVPIYASAAMWCLCGALTCVLPFETHNNAAI